MGFLLWPVTSVAKKNVVQLVRFGRCRVSMASIILFVAVFAFMLVIRYFVDGSCLFLSAFWFAFLVLFFDYQLIIKRFICLSCFYVNKFNCGHE